MLPDTLEIADTLAATLRFDATLTARDRSLLFAVSWYAARSPGVEGGDRCYVPDLPLRRDLGDMRRPDAIREQSRYDRLEDATMRTDETLPDLMDGAFVPIVPAGSRRVIIADGMVWETDERIRRTFQTAPGDAAVGVPLSILAKSRCRYTLPLVLRLLAWGSGYHPSKWRRRSNAAGVVLRIPVSTLQDELGVGGLAPSELLRRELLPAIEEIRAFSDLVVDIEPVHAPSLRRPQGRVMAFDILVGPVEKRVIPMPAPVYETPGDVVPFSPRTFGAFRPRSITPPGAAPPSALVKPPSDYDGW